MTICADFPTDRAGALMGTMSKHFAHKITVTSQADRCLLHFPDGLATIYATETGLRLIVEGSPAETRDRLRDILESHLLRFAHRQNPAPLTWTPDAGDSDHG